MTLWDVFHSERLEAERSLTTEAIREALARRDIVEDDLVRPAGETRWVRLGDSPEFAAFASLILPTREGPPEPEPPPFEPPSIDPGSYASLERELLGLAEPEFELEPEPEPEPEPPPTARQASSITALPVLPDEEAEEPDLPEFDDPDFDEFDPQDEDEEAAEFTLSRNSADRVEELDLAAMVDVAFQLVLFFLVTAQVILFKTLEVPRPNEDKPPEAAAQGRSKSVDELEKDYILVEVDAAGAIKIDRQPVPADRATLVEKLRTSRESTSRKAILLSADFATRHRNAVLVFDIANEIDLRIAIAQPSGKK